MNVMSRIFSCNRKQGEGGEQMARLRVPVGTAPKDKDPLVQQVTIAGPMGPAAIRKTRDRGAWVAQSVERPTLAQVMISWSVSSSPVSGSVLTAQSLEPVSDSVSPSLSLTLPRSCSVSLCLKNKR